MKSTRLISTCPLAIRCPTLIYRLVGSLGALTITSMSLPTLPTPLTSTPLALSVEGGGGGGAGAGGGGGGFGSCQEGGAVNSGSLGRPGSSLGPAVVPVGKPGIEGSPGIDAGEPAMSGEPAGLVPGRPGPAGGRPVIPVGTPGIEGSPGMDAGDPAMFGEPAGLAPGRPGAAWGRSEIGPCHCGGIEVNGRLGRLETSAGLWGLGSSAVAPPPGVH